MPIIKLFIKQIWCKLLRYTRTFLVCKSTTFAWFYKMYPITREYLAVKLPTLFLKYFPSYYIKAYKPRTWSHFRFIPFALIYNTQILLHIYLKFTQDDQTNATAQHLSFWKAYCQSWIFHGKMYSSHDLSENNYKQHEEM